MNAELLCHPLHSAFLALHLQPLSCSRSTNHTLPTAPGHWLCFGQVGWWKPDRWSSALKPAKKVPITISQQQETTPFADHQHKRGKSGGIQHCKDLMETSSAGLDPV